MKDTTFNTITSPTQIDQQEKHNNNPNQASCLTELRLSDWLDFQKTSMSYKNSSRSMEDTNQSIIARFIYHFRKYA